MNRQFALLLSLMFLLLTIPSSADAQAWSGILDPSRAIDWRNVPFSVPSGSWMQCGSTIAPYSGTAATINTAIAGCAANHFVLLGAGTFNLSSCIDWAGHSFVVVRGSGPMNTTVKFSAGCSGYSGGTDVNLRAATNTYDQSTANLPGGSNSLTVTGTAGSASGGPTGAGLFPQGATQITVSNVGSDKPVVGTMLELDQADDVSPSSGWLQCVSNVSNPGCSESGGNANGRIVGGVGYDQIQVVRITAINGSTYTFTPGLYANNLRTSQSPGAWWNFSSKLCTQCGIENVTLDHTASGGNSQAVSAILFYDCYQCWVKNIRNIYGGTRNHIFIIQSAQGVIRDSYFFNTVGNSSGGGYGIDTAESSDFLVENNIFDELDTPVIFEDSSGFIIGYNFTWNNIFVNANWMQVSYGSHDPGNMMNLWEGNYMNGVTHDSTNHGVSPVVTYFRNHLPGNQPVPNDKAQGTGSGAGLGTTPFEFQALNHGLNLIGNVAGIITCVGGNFAGRPADENSQCTGGSATGPSWHRGYETSPNVGTATPIYKGIYTLGWPTGSAVGSSGNLHSDTGVATTMMRWGNYDTFTGGVSWNASEVPTTATPFLNAVPVPSSHTLPPSLYYAAKPAWYTSAYGNPPFPPIGPDVTGGELAGVGGHAYRNPARLCYENTAQDASNYPGTSVIRFDASVCYGSGSASDPPPVAPTNISAVVH